MAWALSINTPRGTFRVGRESHGLTGQKGAYAPGSRIEGQQNNKHPALMIMYPGRRRREACPSRHAVALYVLARFCLLGEGVERPTSLPTLGRGRQEAAAGPELAGFLLSVATAWCWGGDDEKFFSPFGGVLMPPPPLREGRLPGVQRGRRFSPCHCNEKEVCGGLGHLAHLKKIGPGKCIL